MERLSIEKVLFSLNFYFLISFSPFLYFPISWLIRKKKIKKKFLIFFMLFSFLITLFYLSMFFIYRNRIIKDLDGIGALFSSLYLLLSSSISALLLYVFLGTKSRK
jgi:hypothetical protein